MDTTNALTKSEPHNPLAVIPDDVSAAALELAVGKNDLSRLSATDRMKYIGQICKWVGLNPLTQPIKIINIKGKDTLYADKSCAEQLRGLHRISTTIIERVYQDGCYVVRAKARTPDGQEDESIGAAPCHERSTGEEKANAMMRAETKAKRRVTLSIKGLGFLPDESELETIKEVKSPADVVSGAQTASDRAAELNATIEAEVISPEKGGAGGVGEVRPEAGAKEPVSDNDTAASTEPSLSHAKPASTQPPAPSAGVPAPQPATPAGTTAATGALPANWKGEDGKLVDEVVQRIEEVLMEGGDPAKAMKFLAFKKKIVAGEPLNTLTVETAKYIIMGPAKFNKLVKEWDGTQKA